jgi:UDPglucose 6-dehydrogenase
VDIDEAKVSRMQNGEVPIYEPGLEEIFAKVLFAERAGGKVGQLSVTTDLASAVDGVEVIFLALPTPPGADGSADLSAVLQVASELGGLLKQYTVIVDKSTVPVGTSERVGSEIARDASVEFDVVSNPEFLREGLAVQDFMHPDRIVIGTSSARARDVMREVYASFVDEPEQLVFMDTNSAEMTKYAANAFLAMKVTFMNEIANLCELVGADVGDVKRGIGRDPRIGRQFLNAGIGYGGSCFPKDVKALNFTAREHGYTFRLLQSIIEVNEDQKKLLVQKLKEYYGGELLGKKVALWGLSFKPNTDDIREAPALEIIEALLAAGAAVSAYDPEATGNVKHYFGDRDRLVFAASPDEAANGADALLIATEWDDFRAPHFDKLKSTMARPVIFDGRNMYDPAMVAGHGFEYFSVGRPAAA